MMTALHLTSIECIYYVYSVLKMMQHDDDEGDDNFNDASFLTIIRQLDLFEGISTEV